VLPRLLAILLLLISLATFVPLVAAAILLARGREVDPLVWWAPLLILATGAMLTWLLSRRQIALGLYVAAFALWLVTAGYFFTRIVALWPR
jgi:hypothetical protein